MTTCTEVREQMLEANLATLRAGASGAFGAHLATCASCRAMADRILAGTEALADALARTSSRPPAVAAAAARLAGRRVRTRRRTVRVAVPLLAAASLVVLLARSPAKPAISPAQPDRAALPPIVEAGGQHVAVFTTHRPDIVVVWQF